MGRKMAAWKLYLFSGLFLFTLFLGYYFPAGLAWTMFCEQPGKGVRLSGLTGTWHRGKAVRGQAGNISMRDISWRLRPSPVGLITTEFSFSLAAPQKAIVTKGNHGLLHWIILQLISLGSQAFQGEAAYHGKGLQVLFVNKGGAADISGSLLIHPDRRYDFSATLKPRDQGSHGAEQLILLLGRPDSEGAVKVRYAGMLD